MDFVSTVYSPNINELIIKWNKISNAQIMENDLKYLCDFVEKRINSLEKSYKSNNKQLKPKRIIEEISKELVELLSSCPEYEVLLMFKTITELHYSVSDDIGYVTENMTKLRDNFGKLYSLIYESYNTFVQKNKDFLNSILNHSNDFFIDLFGFNTLKMNYLKKDHNSKTIERISQMYMRVTIIVTQGLKIKQENGNFVMNKQEQEKLKTTYHLLSNGYYTHATPTLSNSASKLQQLASCFLLDTDNEDNSARKLLNHVDAISSNIGGIAINMSRIMCRDSFNRETGFKDSTFGNIQVMDKMGLNSIDGKRKTAKAFYLEPWHGDIEFFLNLKKIVQKEELQAVNIFIALWIPDLFMERVENNENWSLFCPYESERLWDTCGEEFEELYKSYEKDPTRIKKSIDARKLWDLILEIQRQSGVPYIMYKDAVNRKSNQKHIGTITCSNLCTEIVQWCSPNSYAICTLASVCLNKFVKDSMFYKGTNGIYYCDLNFKNKAYFDFDELGKVVQTITRNLDSLFEINYYPIPELIDNAFDNRAIGIGVQGLADAIMMMDYIFDGDESLKLNAEIFETMYFHAIKESMMIAKERGYPCKNFYGSPISKGLFQFDLVNEERRTWKHIHKDLKNRKVRLSGKWDWDWLRKEVMKYGVSNMYFIALMPTASTSQILKNNECIEPYTTNLYIRGTMAGKYRVWNKFLIAELRARNLWTPEIIKQLTYNSGSVQSIDIFDERLKKKYRTVWEIPHRSMARLSLARSPFVDQAESSNVFYPEPTLKKMSSYLFLRWKYGLKNGSYYTTTKVPELSSRKMFSQLKERKQNIEKITKIENKKNNNTQKEFCSRNNRDCLVCSS